MVVVVMVVSSMWCGASRIHVYIYYGRRKLDGRWRSEIHGKTRDGSVSLERDRDTCGVNGTNDARRRAGGTNKFASPTPGRGMNEWEHRPVHGARCAEKSFVFVLPKRLQNCLERYK